MRFEYSPSPKFAKTVTDLHGIEFESQSVSPKKMHRFALRARMGVRRNVWKISHVCLLSTRADRQQPDLRALLAEYRSGYSLPSWFYTSDALFDVQINKLWPQQWLFAGYENQIRQRGAYFVYTVGNNSVLVLRDKHGTVRFPQCVPAPRRAVDKRAARRVHAAASHLQVPSVDIQLGRNSGARRPNARQRQL